MADQQIGNVLGVVAISPDDGKIAEITADGANTVTVATKDIHKFRVGQQFCLRDKTTGSRLTTVRTVTALTDAGVITYSGADAASVAGTHAIYDIEDVDINNRITQDGKIGLNGGTAASHGFAPTNFGSIQDIKARLTTLDSGYFTKARMRTMTYNDLVYALRVREHASSIK